MTKKSLSPKVVKKPSTPQYSAKEIKEMYAVVATDLISKLRKLKKTEEEQDQTLKFADFGTFEKTQHKKKMKNNKLFKNIEGKTYQYYRLNFRASSHLKRELDK
ncbi:MAG: hypothetical protein LBR43_00795 [Spiroplasmataceae bacterium]|jgi:nucleoid DNA-binding protein|nr:hypothetical protein [Spiroplasmataceae bacterium]